MKRLLLLLSLFCAFCLPTAQAGPPIANAATSIVDLLMRLAERGKLSAAEKAAIQRYRTYRRAQMLKAGWKNLTERTPDGRAEVSDCPNCRGSGTIYNRECYACSGTGVQVRPVAPQAMPSAPQPLPNRNTQPKCAVCNGSGLAIYPYGTYPCPLCSMRQGPGFAPAPQYTPPPMPRPPQPVECYVPCNPCGGQGFNILGGTYYPCNFCNGTGVLKTIQYR